MKLRTRHRIWTSASFCGCVSALAAIALGCGSDRLTSPETLTSPTSLTSAKTSSTDPRGRNGFASVIGTPGAEGTLIEKIKELSAQNLPIEREGDEAFRIGDYETAERLYLQCHENSVVSDGKHRWSWVSSKLARVYIELDRPADAIGVLRSTERVMVSDVFKPLLCLAYLKLNDFANAKKALVGPMYTTLNIEGDDPVIPRPRTLNEYEATAWAALAMEAYTTSSPIEEQELLFGRAYRLWPDQPIIELYWGVTQGRLKRYEEAEALLLSARAKGSGEFARSIGVKLQRISSLADMERRKRNG